MSHTVNGQPVAVCSSCPSISPGGFFGVAPAPPPASEGVVYANLVDAVKLLNKMVENTHYNCTREEAELIWRLRFVTRIEP